jgi:hypothetical protein
MKTKTILYLSLLCLALLLLALGGWIAKGVTGLADQTKRSPLRPRHA